MEGCYEQIKCRIEELKEASQDPLFTDYLKKLDNRLIQEKYQLDLLRTDLERSYQLYLKRRNPEQTGEMTEADRVQQTQESDSLAGQINEALQNVPRPQTPPEPPYGAAQTFGQAPVYQTPPVKAAKKDKEFVIGIGVFSVIGVFFVLAAFVMLGMYFMNGFVKGMLLYAIAVAVWLVSEFVVRKRSYRLSITLTSIGIAGLYISTLVNYLYLENFNELVAGIVLVAVTLVVFLVNRKKTLGIIQMASVAISTWVLMINNAVSEGVSIQSREIYLVAYFVLSMLLIEAILCRLSKEQGTNRFLYTVYGISMTTCAIGCNSVLNNVEEQILIRTGILAAVVVMGALFFYLIKNEKAKWTQLFFVYGMALVLYILRPACWQVSVVLLLMMLFVKLLPDNIPAKICNVVTTSIAAFFVLAHSGQLEGYLVLGGLVLSVLLIRYWQVCYEAIITFTAVLVVFMEVESVLVLPVALAVLWLSVVLFNQIERYRGKYIGIYNMLVLVCASFCYLWMLLEDYSEVRIMYLILTVLGLGIIGFIFQEKNKLANARGIVIVSFLTYMILACDFTYDITSSVMLMLVGLGSIGAGFALTDKKLRIYGLVLSMLVCFKITLFDFRGEDALQKMLLFLAAGVVSLIISGIYVVLDKKYNK